MCNARSRKSTSSSNVCIQMWAQSEEKDVKIWVGESLWQLGDRQNKGWGWVGRGKRAVLVMCKNSHPECEEIWGRGFCPKLKQSINEHLNSVEKCLENKNKAS
uniref:Uncharacterized protein n=1 Tax=Sphaerodactylus townsendi TaxID=933632 RepID=A0ACB8ETX2_9SAUR